MNDYVFIAHPIEFFSKSLKSFAEEEGINVYILDSYDDFDYLVEDLKPHYLFFHEDIYSANKGYIDSVVGKHNCELAIIGVKDQSISNFFVSPLDPLTLSRDISNMIKEGKNG